MRKTHWKTYPWSLLFYYNFFLNNNSRLLLVYINSWSYCWRVNNIARLLLHHNCCWILLWRCCWWWILLLWVWWLEIISWITYTIYLICKMYSFIFMVKISIVVGFIGWKVFITVLTLVVQYPKLILDWCLLQ